MSKPTKSTAPIKEVRRVVANRNKIEVRRNADGSRSISGSAVVYNSLSEDLGFREVIKPGAFTQSLRDNPDVLCLYGHDDNQILGRVSSGTLTIEDTPTALRFTCKLPNTTWANDLIILLERGDVSAMSFGFVCLDDTWTDAGNHVLRAVNVATLFEVSVVGQPAYPAASVSLRTVPKSLRSKIAGMLTDAEAQSFIDSVSDDSDADNCDCDCDACEDDRCEECSADDCDDEVCAEAGCKAAGQTRALRLHLKLAQQRAKMI